ncbi:hypothetical protein C9374_012229 [Naegleria lovaniensis]|uniref:Uncharacterized protein n=1 Tax=Naegleria lovaniensis TaxID=51637 RepID=A0AA88GEG3_NAELO|nr:uncharacterized protein C9374_012229 [Naegleria lovaniensis]KAG2373363.1 hypothetical protein C9374_012229 [Naegleria lovaniensis]
MRNSNEWQAGFSNALPKRFESRKASVASYSRRASEFISSQNQPANKRSSGSEVNNQSSQQQQQQPQTLQAQQYFLLSQRQGSVASSNFDMPSTVGGASTVQQPHMNNSTMRRLSHIERHKSKSTVSKTSTGSDRTKKGTFYAIESNLFLFVNSLKLEKPMNRALYFFIQLIGIWQTLSLGVSIDFNWGEYGRYFYHAIVAPRTFGFQFLPYDALFGVAIAAFLLDTFALFTLYLTYRSFINGSKYWAQIKASARFSLAIITMISLPAMYVMLSFWRCDYSHTVTLGEETTYVLKKFPSTACWSATNGAMAAVSIIFIVLQTLMTTFAMLIFSNTSISSKSFFTVDTMILNVSIQGLNHIFLLASQLIPDMYYYIRPIFYMVTSLCLFLILVWQTPFVYRYINSFYGGLFIGQVGIGIGSLVATLTNNSDAWDVGLGLSSGPIGGLILGFTIGFIGVDIYTHILKRKGKKLIEGVMESRNLGDISERDYFFVGRFVKFSMKSNDKDQATCNSFVRLLVNYKDPVPTETLITTALFMKYVLENQSTTFVLMLFKKAERQNNNFLTRFNIFLRYREIERVTSTGRNNFEIDHILDGILKSSSLLRHLQVRFWKHISSGQEIINTVMQMEEITRECEQIFKNLMFNHRENKTVLRAYASFLEEFLFEPIMAEELYNEANILEEEEAEKSKVKVKAPSKNPLTASLSKEEAVDLLKMGTMNEEELAHLESASQNHAENDTDSKLQEQYRTSINKFERNGFVIVFLLSLGVISIVYMSVIFALDWSFTGRVNDVLQVVNDICLIAPIPYTTLGDIRRVNLALTTTGTVNNITYDEHKTQVKRFTKDIDHLVSIARGNLFTTSMKNRFTDIDKTYNVAITKLENVTGLEFYSKNASASMIINTLSTLMTEISEFNISSYNETYKNFYFSMLYVNRITFTHALESFYNEVIADELNTQQQENTVSIVVFSSLTGFFVLYVSIYLVFIWYHVRQRKLISKLFNKIPTTEITKIAHHLEASTDNSVVSQKTYVLTPTRLMVFWVTMILILTTIAAILIMYEGLSQQSSSILIMRKLNYSAKLLMITQRMQFKTQELIQPDYNVIGIDRHQFYSEIGDHLTEFSEIWNALRYGTNEDSFYALGSLSTSINGILIKPSANCSAVTQSVNCMGLDDIMKEYHDHISKARENIYRYTFTRDVLLKEVDSMYVYGDKILTDVSSIMDLLVKSYTGQAKVMGAVSAAIAFILLLFIIYLLYSAINKFSSENHQLRLMLNHLPAEILDTDNDLRSYILYNSLNSHTKHLEKNNQQDSYEKAILEAAVAGAVICSSYGSIDIFNESAQKLFGYRIDEVIGVSVTSLFCPESRGTLENVINNMSTSTKSYGENLFLQGQRKNRTLFPIQLRISVTSIDGRNIISCFMTDLTTDREHDQMLAEEKKKSESLLLNILPESIAHRLSNGETFIADNHEDVTCLFSDLVGFLEISASMSATELVQTLNIIINGFDSLIPKYQLEKIKTIGEKYFCAGGLKVRADEGDNHEERVLKFAMEMFSVVYNYNVDHHHTFNLRVGMHCGALVSGVIGTLKFAYDVWGDAVNTSSRMESTGKTGRIQVTAALYKRLRGKYRFEKSSVFAKGKGELITYLLDEKYYQNTSPEAPALEASNYLRQQIATTSISQSGSAEDLSEKNFTSDEEENTTVKRATPPLSQQQTTMTTMIATNPLSPLVGIIRSGSNSSLADISKQQGGDKKDTASVDSREETTSDSGGNSHRKINRDRTNSLRGTSNEIRELLLKNTAAATTASSTLASPSSPSSEKKVHLTAEILRSLAEQHEHDDSTTPQQVKGVNLLPIGDNPLLARKNSVSSTASSSTTTIETMRLSKSTHALHTDSSQVKRAFPTGTSFSANINAVVAASSSNLLHSESMISHHRPATPHAHCSDNEEDDELVNTEEDPTSGDVSEGEEEGDQPSPPPAANSVTNPTTTIVNPIPLRTHIKE